MSSDIDYICSTAPSILQCTKTMKRTSLFDCDASINIAAQYYLDMIHSPLSISHQVCEYNQHMINIVTELHA